ncbi:MAG: repeat protein [Mucilaginibacter sp.]|nr:repeat protein [Mucilaginibacter sp.]
MKDDELEDLAAEYVSGNMPERLRADFEQVLENNAKAKQLVNEVSLAWRALSGVTGQEEFKELDENFYAFLDSEKSILPVSKVRHLRPVTYWLSSAAAAIALVATFFLGRSSINGSHKVIKYKIVEIIKPGPVRTKVIKVNSPAIAVRHKNSYKSEGLAMIRQLQSPYSSKRISSVLEIGNRELNETYMKALNLTLKHDTDPNVQLAVLQVLRAKAGSTEVQSVLIDALPDLTGIAQSFAVDILIERKCKAAVPEMLALLEDEHTDYHTQGQIRLGMAEYLN